MQQLSSLRLIMCVIRVGAEAHQQQQPCCAASWLTAAGLVTARLLCQCTPTPAQHEHTLTPAACSAAPSLLLSTDLPEALKQAAEAAGGVAALKHQVETCCALHTCACGDTLASIAAGMGACPQTVATLNPQVQDPAAPLTEGAQVLVPSAQALQNGMGCAGGDEDGDEGMGGFFGNLAKQLANHAIDQLPI